MTNEELVERIAGGNDDLLPVLWDQTRAFFKCKTEKYARRFCKKCAEAGVTKEDLLQECYFVLLEAVRAYTARAPKHASLRFITFCRYPMQNHFGRIIGFRGGKDPINSGVLSLNDCVRAEDGEEKLTFLETLEDPDAEQPFRDFEDRSFYRSARQYIREVLEEGGMYDYEVIERRYFRRQTLPKISAAIGLSQGRVQQIEKTALKRLRHCYELRRLVEYSPYRHVGLENFKHNGSIEEQIVEKKELDQWRQRILEEILKKKR